MIPKIKLIKEIYQKNLNYIIWKAVVFIIDFHTHILPKVDDGSKSIEESLSMLKMLRRQEVSIVIATPHFYPSKMSIEDFLVNRNNAYCHLKEKVVSDIPEIILGAEVYYFPGMGKCEELYKLAIGNTRLILVELPFHKWDSQVMEDIELIESNLKLKVIIAHLDRYFHIKQNQNYISELFDSDFTIQLNLQSFSSFFTGRKLFGYIKKYDNIILGSDCHNMETRKPNWVDAIPLIKKKCGIVFIDKINLLSKRLLTNNENRRGN